MIKKLIEDKVLTIELVSKVLDLPFYMFIYNKTGIGYKEELSYCKYEVNENTIYEFVFKDCKEWAYKQGYDLHSFKSHCTSWKLDESECKDHLDILVNNIKEFEAKTEIEAILKACNWIIENEN